MSSASASVEQGRVVRMFLVAADNKVAHLQRGRMYWAPSTDVVHAVYTDPHDEHELKGHMYSALNVCLKQVNDEVVGDKPIARLVVKVLTKTEEYEPLFNIVREAKDFYQWPFELEFQLM